MESVSLNRFRKNLGLNRYFRVTTYPRDLSDLILSSLQGHDDSHLYFDDSGSLALSTPNGVIQRVNDLTKREVELISSNIVTGDGNYVYSSGFGAWFLNKDKDGLVSLYYNPIPRPEYVDWFKRDPINAMNLLIDVCTENKGRDPVCSCINKQTDREPDTEFCLNELFGGDVKLRKSVKASSKNRVGYNQLEEICGCANVRCNKSHPLILQYRLEGGGHECPKDINISICNATFSSGGTTNFSGDIQQQCGSEFSPPEVDPTPPSPPGPTPPTPGPTPPAPTPPTPPAPPTPDPTPSPVPDKTNSFSKWFLSLSRGYQTAIIISLVVSLILILFGGVKANTPAFVSGCLFLLISLGLTVYMFKKK